MFFFSFKRTIKFQAEGLFAAANVFSALKLVHLFSINPHLGPLQISLGRMVIDIVKFLIIYTLVLFAFACGEYQPAHIFILQTIMLIINRSVFVKRLKSTAVVLRRPRKSQMLQVYIHMCERV